MRFGILVASSATAFLLASPAPLPAQPLPVGNPATLGFSPERLASMERSLERFVDEGQHAGVSWIVARRGRIVSSGARGFRDVEARLPMEMDTICRIYSMSKIVTSVGALALLEEGHLDLADPVSRYLPEFEHMQVFTGGTARDPLLATANGPITVEHLLTHTSGLYYNFSVEEPLRTLFDDAKLGESTTLEEYTRRAARLPLKHQPGAAWTYGISTAVLGRVIEVASGLPLEDFLRQRILDPLGMVDTGFGVPPGKRDRLAKVYSRKDGRLQPVESLFFTWVERGAGPALGDAGLFSTIADYSRFAQMLANGGVLDGRRVLGRKTVEFMRTNRLADLPPGHIDNPSQGFGLGVSVTIAPGESSALVSPGRFGWSGAATTDCGIDPVEQIVALVFAQHFPFDEHRLFERFSNGYLQALVDEAP
jgi:CubicO group peptidase (beta-lactamase class C family)